MIFGQKLENIVERNNSLLCIGLDTDLKRIPKHLRNSSDSIFKFNKAIIDATNDLICAYKPNIAFYEAYGIEGLKSLKKTIEYLKGNLKDIPIILDAKRGDIGNTAKMYAKAVFDYWGADAVTINPYLGFDSIEPFLEWKDKGIIILCKTSNPGAKDFQDIQVSIPVHLKGVISKQEALYITVAKKIVAWNKKYGNCLMVVGATYTGEIKKVRKIAKDIFFLVPGIGSQGGDFQKTLQFGLTKDKSGLIINISRAIIYASKGKDFAEKAREEAKKIKELINKYRYG